jgi:Zn-dependent M32 family carboxypeptidase
MQAAADCLARGRDRYDVLLDEWEPGLTWATREPMLARLRLAVGPVVSENSAGRDPVTGYGLNHGTIGP